MKETLRPSGGHILDIDSLEIAKQYLAVAHNVNTRKGFPSRVGGRRVSYPVSAGGAPNDPFHLLNLSLNTFNWWMLFGASTIYGVETTNSNNISMAGQIAVSNPFEWDSTLLNGIPIFTNGKNLLSYWVGAGGTPAATLTGWPVGTVCHAVAAFKFHIFALNIDGPGGTFTNQVKWSDAAAPGAIPTTWTPGAANEAGDLILADTPGQCVCGRPLGQQLSIFKPASIYAIEYAGQPPGNIFTARPVIRTAGALGPHTVIEISGPGQGTPRLLCVGNGDVVLYDGVGAVSIADNKIKRYLSNSIDETYAANSFVIRDLDKRETWVCVPEQGNQFANIAHVWDERRDTWVTRDLNAVRYGTTGFTTDTSVSDIWDADAAVWDSDAETWNQSDVGTIAHVVVAEASKMYVEDTADATSKTARIVRYDLDFGDSEQIKVTSRIHIEGSGTDLDKLQVRLGSRNDTDASIAFQSFVNRQAGGNPYEVTGRFISFEIQHIGTETNWTVSRITIYAEATGAQ